jgi:hypothetical protein
MPDMSERMARTAKKQGAATASAAPFAKPPKRYPRRVTLDLTDEVYAAVRKDAFAGEVALAALLRGMVATCRENPKLLKEATERARLLA